MNNISMHSFLGDLSSLHFASTSLNERDMERAYARKVFYSSLSNVHRWKMKKFRSQLANFGDVDPGISLNTYLNMVIVINIDCSLIFMLTPKIH